MNIESYKIQLNEIGDKIKECTNIPILDISDTEKAKKAIQLYQNHLNKLISVVSEMEKIKPPINIESENNELIEELRDYVNGLKILWRSFSTDNLNIHPMQNNLGNNIVDKSVTCIVDIIKRILDKL